MNRENNSSKSLNVATNDRPKSDKTELKICIIGAGPGGCSVGLALKELGYKNVTIYEKASKAGGQVYTGYFKTEQGKSVPYEQCTIQPMGSYYLNKLIKKYNLHYLEKEKIKFYSLSEKKLLADMSSPNNMWSIGLAYDFIKMFIQLIKFRYLYKPGFKDIRHKEILAESINHWINTEFPHSSKHMELLLDSLNGFISFHNPRLHIPVIYALKIIYQGLHPPVRYINLVIRRIEEGFQELWLRAAKDLNVIYNADLKKITRTHDSILVEVNGKIEKFDKLIIACQRYTQFLDCTDDEKYVESKLHYVGSLRTSFLGKNCNLDHLAIFLDSLHGKKEDICFTITSIKKINDTVGLYTANYQPTTLSKEKIIELTNESLEMFGGELIEIVSIHRQPYYGAHFKKEDILNNIFEISERRQGVNNTYFVGEVLSCGTNAIIVDYSYSLVKKYF